MKIAVEVMMLATASACALAQNVSNPVVASAKEIFQRQSGYMVAAAEQMPADKYGYHPTPDQWTYGKIVSHVIQANFAVCGMLSGDDPGTGPAVADTTPKDQLVPILKQSFETCQKALDGLQDSSLGGTITYFRGAKKPRARALIELIGDLEDHYSQMASYLRMNGMRPPSAKTEASAKPVHLDSYMAEDLLQWRRVSTYPMPHDWVFASPTMKGTSLIGRTILCNGTSGPWPRRPVCTNESVGILPSATPSARC